MMNLIKVAPNAKSYVAAGSAKAIVKLFGNNSTYIVFVDAIIDGIDRVQHTLRQINEPLLVQLTKLYMLHPQGQKLTIKELSYYRLKLQLAQSDMRTTKTIICPLSNGPITAQQSFRHIEYLYLIAAKEDRSLPSVAGPHCTEQDRVDRIVDAYNQLMMQRGWR